MANITIDREELGHIIAEAVKDANRTFVKEISLAIKEGLSVNSNFPVPLVEVAEKLGVPYETARYYARNGDWPTRQMQNSNLRFVYPNEFREKSVLTSELFGQKNKG